ncbi:MAG: M48 family metalloprotease [Bacteroidota bacterium]|nr:M48 family metalloprotease [Bacteroidota bacterium]
MKRLNIPALVLSVCAVVLLVISCVVNPVTGKKQIMLMSEAQEIELGASYDPQVIATFGLYDNQSLQNFVQAKGTEIGKISHRPNLEYHVKVVDSPVVNAFAVPGGYVYLTRGILAQLNNEAELAGVMGHEIGHVAARHTVSQQSKQQLAQLLLIGGMIASEKFAQYAEYALQGMQLLFLKFSRDDEREADRLGVEYSSKIGYDAHKMADFFKVLQKMTLSESQGGIPTFLSTHPDPGDRYNAVNQLATEWQTNLKNTTWKVNQDPYLQLINGIVYGEDPRQGYAEGNIFYHPELKFKYSFPTGWKLENSPLQVTMTPSDGKALELFTLARQKTLESAADSTIQQYGLTLQGSKRGTVNGMNAIITQCKQTVQDQNTGATSTNMVYSYFISYNGLIYVFHGVTTEADFNTYVSLFDSSMASFSKLTDPSKINVKPKRIFVKQVQRTGTLADAFRYYNVPQAQYNELALMNDLELTDQVQSGKLIKIIGE